MKKVFGIFMITQIKHTRGFCSLEVDTVSMECFYDTKEEAVEALKAHKQEEAETLKVSFEIKELYQVIND